MQNVYIVGTSCTTFGKHADKTFHDLVREAYNAVLADAGLGHDQAALIEQAWFGNCGMGAWGQGGIRGQVCFTPLVEEGLFPERVPMINVEGGCATASFAFHGAWKDVLSGQAQMSLAIGVEKLVSPDQPERVAAIFDTGIDQLEPQRWRNYYAQAGALAGKPFETGPGRTLFMDTYAMQAAWHMKTHAPADRDRCVEEPPPWQPQPQGPVPLRAQRRRGAGRSRNQLAVDALDVLAAGRWCGGSLALLRGGPGQPSACSARPGREGAHLAAVGRQVPCAR